MTGDTKCCVNDFLLDGVGEDEVRSYRGAPGSAGNFLLVTLLYPPGLFCSHPQETGVGCAGLPNKNTEAKPQLLPVDLLEMCSECCLEYVCVA